MFFYQEINNKDHLGIANLINFNTDTFDIFNSEFINKIKDLREVGRFKVTTEVNRPDLVSYSMYGSVRFWRFILMYNDLNFSSDIVSGLILKQFDVSELTALIYELKSKKKDNKVLY